MIRSHTLAATSRRRPASLAAPQYKGRGLRRGHLEDPDPGLGYCSRARQEGGEFNIEDNRCFECAKRIL
jgi:hypothetical protein